MNNKKRADKEEHLGVETFSGRFIYQLQKTNVQLAKIIIKLNKLPNKEISKKNKLISRIYQKNKLFAKVYDFTNSLKKTKSVLKFILTTILVLLISFKVNLILNSKSTTLNFDVSSIKTINTNHIDAAPLRKGKKVVHGKQTFHTPAPLLPYGAVYNYDIKTSINIKLYSGSIKKAYLVYNNQGDKITSIKDFHPLKTIKEKSSILLEIYDCIPLLPVKPFVTIPINEEIIYNSNQSNFYKAIYFLTIDKQNNYQIQSLPLKIIPFGFEGDGGKQPSANQFPDYSKHSPKILSDFDMLDQFTQYSKTTIEEEQYLQDKEKISQLFRKYIS